MTTGKDLTSAWSRLAEEAGEAFNASMDEAKRTAWEAMEEAVRAYELDNAAPRVPVVESGRKRACPAGHRIAGVLHEPVADLRQDLIPNGKGSYAWGPYDDNWIEGVTMRDQDGLPVLECVNGDQFVHQDVTYDKIG